MDNWSKIKNDAAASRRLEHRKIEFVASSVTTKQQLTHEKQLGTTASNGKVSQATSSTVITKSTTNGIVETEKSKDVGLFDPAIATKYARWNKITRVGPGFFNDGNTCYLNSTLQCLVHTPALAQILRHDPKSVLKGLGIVANSQDTKDNRDKDFNLHANRSVLQHFQNLVCDVWSQSSSRSISPRGMVASIRRVGRQFKPLRQEDAHEYLRQLLDCMHEEVLKARGVKTSDGKIAETSMISRVFGGYLCNTLTCGQCQYVSKTFNHFLDMSLDISQGVKSINGAIDSFTKPEYLTAGNEWKCEKCKQKVKAFSGDTVVKAGAYEYIPFFEPLNDDELKAQNINDDEYTSMAEEYRVLQSARRGVLDRTRVAQLACDEAAGVQSTAEERMEMIRRRVLYYKDIAGKLVVGEDLGIGGARTGLVGAGAKGAAPVSDADHDDYVLFDRLRDGKQEYEVESALYEANLHSAAHVSAMEELLAVRDFLSDKCNGAESRIATLKNETDRLHQELRRAMLRGPQPTYLEQVSKARAAGESVLNKEAAARLLAAQKAISTVEHELQDIQSRRESRRNSLNDYTLSPDQSVVH